MKIELEITRKVVIAGVVLIGAMVYAYLFVHNKVFPYSQVAPVGRDVVRYVKTIRMGRDGYVQAELKKQSAQASGDASDRTLETSQLPLKLKFFSLAKVPGFPEGGGAVADVGNTLIVMSRTGEFYRMSGDHLEKLDYGSFPNGLKDYVLSSKTVLTSDAFRAHSLAYDAVTGRLVVGYTRYASPTTNTFVVSTLVVDPHTLQKKGAWKDLFESEPVASSYTSQAGSGRVIVEKGKIYFATGYAEVETKLNGVSVPATQNPNSSLGKVFEIDPATGKPHQLSMGHRNVQGMAVSGQDLLATEQGPQGGDEINLIKEGKNYGWPYTTYGTDYGAYTWASQSPVPKGFSSEEPIYAFVPSISISPMRTITGFQPKWDGDLLVGSLKAQSLFRIVYKQGRVIVSEPVWIGHRIRDIVQSPADRIVLLTDDSYLIFVTVDEDALRGNRRDAGYNFEPKLARCLVCHQFELSTPSSLAPSLAHVVGRKVGGDTFTRYSTAMQHAGGSWDVEKLSRFIADPQSVVPGTAMPKLGLSGSDASDIAKILARQ
jgi:glucose/arabinose dehydrogenase